MGTIEFFKQIIREWRVRLNDLFRVSYYPNIKRTSRVGARNRFANPNNLIMGENSTLKTDSVIMNARARFIMKENSGSAEELMVITGNHMSIVGMNLKQVTDEVKDRLDEHREMDRDVIVDEDVWIGARVTILSGVHIGRGCEIGTGSVLRSSIPPYSVVVGNPAKIIGFRFTPEEIIEHEIRQYPEEKRLPLDLLQKNYDRYFLSRIKEIKQFLSVTF